MEIKACTCPDEHGWCMGSVKSPCCTPETNITLHVNSLEFKQKLKKGHLAGSVSAEHPILDLGVMNFFKIFIYLREREHVHKREDEWGERQREEKADSLLNREPDAGLTPRTLGSCSEPKAELTDCHPSIHRVRSLSPTLGAEITQKNNNKKKPFSSIFICMCKALTGLWFTVPLKTHLPSAWLALLAMPPSPIRIFLKSPHCLSPHGGWSKNSLATSQRKRSFPKREGIREGTPPVLGTSNPDLRIHGFCPAHSPGQSKSHLMDTRSSHALYKSAWGQRKKESQCTGHTLIKWLDNCTLQRPTGVSV